jgi:UDP-N-acetylmuramate dehydrogenase
MDDEVRDTEHDVPLAPWTSVRVGGKADLWVRPRTVDDLRQVLTQVGREGIALTVLGGGANTLVGDQGVRGITLKLPSDLFPEKVEKASSGSTRLTLGAGAPITRLLTLMRKHGLVGAEFLAGIPGTLGGAARMNAGTQNGECWSIIEAIEVFTPMGEAWLTSNEVKPRYRHTELPAQAVITRIRFAVSHGDVAASQATMEADLGYRKRTQPLQQPNFGSVFTNPPKDYAGRLLEAAGMKGAVEGGAQVSTLHANWIVNTGAATAKNVVALMERMRAEVQERFGVSLRPEVQRAGSFE